eukprot:g17193.t1
MEASQSAHVGRWRKIVELGSGRTGSVALCIEPASPTDEKIGGARHHGVLQAVKRVNRQCATSDGALRRLLQEKKALQALGGQNGIVELRRTSKDNENLYFVLEPLLGGPLHRHIRAGSNGHLDVPAVKFYSSEVTSAIAHMHANGFVHRDVKASNIVLGSTGHVKLVDLGCSKQLGPKGRESSGAAGDAECEKTYTYCGTPHCMAPEMVSREGHGYAVDWWALGILIHEMLTGAPPFGYGGGDALLQRIVAGLSELDSRNDGVAASSDEPRFLPIVRQLVCTKPEERLGFVRGAEEIMSHEWFETVDWARTAKMDTDPPEFRKDLGELEYAEGETAGKGVAVDVDPDGLFAGF